jgi:hypothetical protein
MTEDLVPLIKARSLLMLLLVTCEQTLTALDAAGNPLDTDMTEDLRRMVARSREELDALTEKLSAARQPDD